MLTVKVQLILLELKKDTRTSIQVDADVGYYVRMPSDPTARYIPSKKHRLHDQRCEIWGSSYGLDQESRASAIGLDYLFCCMGYRSKELCSYFK
jgi:hypothetical protein